MAKKSNFYLRRKVLSPRYTDMLELKILMYENFLTKFTFGSDDFTLARVLYDEYLQLVSRFNGFQHLNHSSLYRVVSWYSLNIKKPDFLK